MAQMTSYTSKAYRRDKHWFVQCDQFPGAMSTVTRLRQAAEHQREAIAFVADVPEESVEVTVVPVLPEPVADDLAEVRRLRDAAATAEREASERWQHAAMTLREAGLTVRDIGDVLGVSYQRAHQLVTGERVA